MKKTAVLLTTVLTAGMLTVCGRGENTETASAGVSDVETEANSAPGARPEKDVITLKLGMVGPDGSNFHKGILAITEGVNKATGGRITIQVFAGGQLSNERDVYEGVQMDTTDMFTASNAVLTSPIPEMAVLDQPFLFGTIDEARRVIDGIVGTLIAEKTEEQKIHTVNRMDIGFRNIFSTHPVTSLEDMKNLKIRTMESDLHIAAFNAMGAIATLMASGDVSTGLRQGTIDAAENAIANLIANRYYEITKNVTWTSHVPGYMGVFMPDKTWNQVPDSLREDFVEGIKAGAQGRRDYLMEVNETAVKELAKLDMESYGMSINDM